MWGIALLFARKYWLPLALGAALLGLFAYHKVSVAWAHHEGVVEGRAELQPQLDLANENVKTVRAALADQQRAFERMEQAKANAQAASAKALADEQAKAKVWEQQATQYLAIINRPKATDAQVCNRADGILRDAIGVQ